MSNDISIQLHGKAGFLFLMFFGRGAACLLLCPALCPEMLLVIQGSIHYALIGTLLDLQNQNSRICSLQRRTCSLRLKLPKEYSGFTRYCLWADLWLPFTGVFVTDGHSHKLVLYVNWYFTRNSCILWNQERKHKLGKCFLSFWCLLVSCILVCLNGNCKVKLFVLSKLLLLSHWMVI